MIKENPTGNHASLTLLILQLLLVIVLGNCLGLAVSFFRTMTRSDVLPLVAEEE